MNRSRALRAALTCAALAVAVLLARVACAAPCTMPDGGWPDAGVTSADGGVLDVPAQLACGQPAPFAGWELSEGAAERAALAPAPPSAVPLQPDAGSSSSSDSSACLAGGGLVIAGVAAVVGFFLGRASH